MSVVKRGFCWRRIICIFLAVMMLSVALVGCSNDDGSSEKRKEQNNESDTYSSQLSIVVNSSYDDASGVNVATSIIKTAVTVMRSETFINDNICDKAGIDKTASEIKEMTRFSIDEDALIVYIRVTADTPEMAYEIAKAFYNADYSYVTGKVEGCVIATVDSPVMPTAPDKE